MRRLVAVVAALALVWAPQLAVAGPAADAIAALEDRVTALEARVTALEGGAPSPTAAPSPSAAPSAAPSPAPSPTPASTPSPAPTATPAPTWFGRADPWAGLPFGSFPEVQLAAGTQWRISGDQNGRVISKLTFRNRTGAGFLYLDGVRNLTVEYLDFDTVPEGIVMYNSSNVTIRYIRARNIFGPYTRTLAHTGNLFQFVHSSNITISDLKVDQPDTVPAGYTAYGTEDIISLGGTIDGITIDRFAFDGGAWGSRSGTGMFVGDGSQGKNVTVRDGVLHTPGQVGIGMAGPGPYRFERIDIYGDCRALSNDPVQIWATTNVSIGNVRADFRKGSWYTAGCPKVGVNKINGGSYTDLGGNNWAAVLDLAAMQRLAAP